MDWSELFAVHVSPVELIVRGTLMYWFLLLIFRFVLRRDPGSLGVADILLVVIIADASQNGMSGSYQTVAEGLYPCRHPGDVELSARLGVLPVGHRPQAHRA